MKLDRIRLRVVGTFILAMMLGACNQAEPEEPAIVEESQVETAKVLNFYNWDTYIDPEILTNFEQAYGVTIDYQIFDMDTDMMEELQAGATDRYDLVVPSDVTVTEMRNDGLLAPLNKENIPNFENVDPTFISPVFDPANRYCAPYQWGTVGIGYNVGAIGKEITGWSDFFDPEFAGRVALMDDYRTTMGLALIMLGYSPNTSNRTQIAEATQFLKEHKEQIGGYVGDDAQDLLLEGKYDMVMEWSGDIFQVMEEAPDIQYVIPSEGSIIWVDNICIPADAPHKAMAETFINYLLDPEVGATLSNYVQYGSPNQASLPFIDEEVLSDPAIYPTEAVRERLFFLVDVGAAVDGVYQLAWDEILSHHGS
ncbi:MAG: spermidine/putrescine ABC transporter substrate-binding protein [Chloroflexota bacterium]